MGKGVDYSKLNYYGTKQYGECTVNIYLDESVTDTDQRIEQYYRTKYGL